MQATAVRDDVAPLDSPYRIVNLAGTHLRCPPCSCEVAVVNRTVVRGRCAPAADHFGLDAPAGDHFGLDAPAADHFGLDAPAADHFGLVFGIVGLVAGQVAFASTGQGRLASQPVAVVYHLVAVVSPDSDRENGNGYLRQQQHKLGDVEPDR